MLVLALVPMLALWLDAPAGAAEADAATDAVVVQGPVEALESMARQVALENDAPYEETLAMLAYQQRAGQLLTELDDSGRLPEAFAGSEFLPDDPQAMIWYFKDEAPLGFPPEAVAALPGLRLVGGQRYSLTELIELQNAVHDAVVEFGHDNVSSSFDLGTQKITVEVSDGTQRGSVAGERRAFVAREVEAALGHRAVDVEVVDLPSGPAVELLHAYGGAWFRDDGADRCTSGFVAYGSAGYGPLTAAHCEGLNQLADAGSGASFSAPFVAEHIGYWGDVEFHTSSHYSYAQFYVSDTTRRTVTSRITNSAISVNASVCRYGRASSNEDCGTVSAIDTTSTFDWSWCDCEMTARQLVETTGIIATHGDSGGPVYSGSVAWGITHGVRFEYGFPRFQFSKIQSAELVLGVTVAT